MIKILIAGDFVPYFRVKTQIEFGDYSCLDAVKPIIQTVDYAIVNFESPAVRREANPILKTGPNLMCTDKAMECVASAGFHCVTLANNHFRDFGQVGVEDTIDSCRKYNVDYVGGGKDLLEAEKILYKEINGKTIAIINVCENEWSIATAERGGSAPLDSIRNYYSICEAKRKADYTIVIVHGGTEHYNLPTPRMKETYRFLIDCGADAVINHHQHCYSGYEVWKGKPIFYGLGNFCFDREDAIGNELWTNGLLVELVLDKDVSFELFPIIQCHNNEAIVSINKDTEPFLNSIRELNMIINDDEALLKHYSQMARKGLQTAKNVLIPYSSRIMRGLCFHGFLPSFFSKKRACALLGNIQCEAHRDILLNGLNLKLKQ